MKKQIIPDSSIQSELDTYNKPQAYEGLAYPINELVDRQFEILLYHLFKKRIEKGEFKNQFDSVSLMQGTGEKGRDIILSFKGKPVGLIQCKKKNKNLVETEVIKEILKFILNYLADETLISDIKNFTYFFAVSTGFTGNCRSYLEAFNNRILNEQKLQEWSEKLINDYETLKHLKYNDIQKRLKEVLSSIIIKKCLPEDITLWISNNNEVIQNFFTIKLVTDNSHIVGIKSDIAEIKNAILSSPISKTQQKLNLRKKLNESENFGKLWIDLETKFIPYLNTINTNFKEYTDHDHSKLESRENTLDLLISEKVYSLLNQKEIFCTMFCLWGLDIGLGANKEIIELFCKKNNLNLPENKIKFILKYQDELRNIIIVEIIDSFNHSELSNLKELIIDILNGQEEQTLENLPITESNGHEIINLVFISVLVKLSDILQLSQSNIPVSMLNLRRILKIYPNEIHFLKDSKLNIVYKQNSSLINMKVNAKNINAFKFLTDYFDYTKKEFDFYASLFTRRHLGQNGLTLNTFHIIQEISKTSFIPEVVLVDIDKNLAISALTGIQIYNDSSIFIRELIQNSIDACHVRKSKKEFSYKPIIKVEYNSAIKQFKIFDNGIGMTFNDLKERLFLSFSKGFRDLDDNDDLISKFGIGFLTVFIVSKDIKIITKHFNSSTNEAFEVNLKNYSQPIEINQIKHNETGTIIIVNLDEDFSLTKKNILKWLTLENQEYSISFFYDDEDLSLYTESLKPVTNNPELNFIEKKFYYECEEYIVILRAWSLFRSGKFISTCGLSFQRNEYMPSEIINLPDLKKKIYYYGVPLKENNEEGSASRFATEIYKPLFIDLYCSLTFNIKKPGLIDLNISRNEFLKTERNSSIFKKTDNDIPTLLKNYYIWLIKEHNITPHDAASNVIGQYWLWKIPERAIIPGDLNTEKAFPDSVYYELSEIWKGINCKLLCNNGLEEIKPFKEIYESNRPMIYIDENYIKWIREHQRISSDLLIEEVNNILEKHFSQGYFIVTGIENNYEKGMYKKSIEPFSFFKALAVNCAFLDLSETTLKTTPLVMYSYQKNILPESNFYKIALYGSTKTIGGFVDRVLGNGKSSGSGLFDIFYNVLNEFTDLSFIENKFSSFEERRELTLNKGANQMIQTRQAFSEFLKTINNGKEIEKKYLSPCLSEIIMIVSPEFKDSYY